MRVSKGADENRIWYRLSLARDDFHFNATPTAGKPRLQIKQCGVDVLGRQFEQAGNCALVEADAHASSAHLARCDGGRYDRHTALANGGREILDFAGGAKGFIRADVPQDGMPAGQFLKMVCDRSGDGLLECWRWQAPSRGVSRSGHETVGDIVAKPPSMTFGVRRRERITCLVPELADERRRVTDAGL